MSWAGIRKELGGGEETNRSLLSFNFPPDMLIPFLVSHFSLGFFFSGLELFFLFQDFYIIIIKFWLRKR